MPVIIAISKFIAKILFRIKIYGAENMKDVDYGVVCANHTTNFDGPLLYVSLPKQVYPLAKNSLFKIPILGWFLKKAGVYPVDRSKKDASAAMHAVDLVKENKFVLIFPEGTRNGLERGIPIKKGAIRIANTANCKIIPVYVTEKPKLFHEYNIVIGRPIKYDIPEKDKKYMQECTEDLMNKIMNLKEEIK